MTDIIAPNSVFRRTEREEPIEVKSRIDILPPPRIEARIERALPTFAYPTTDIVNTLPNLERP
jgi:hypothetical protein